MASHPQSPELVGRGVEVSEALGAGIFRHAGTEETPVQTTYESASDLSQALQRAATAHGEHEARTGERMRSGRRGTPNT